MKDKMFVITGAFVPYNDTVTLLSYKRLRNLDLDMDVFALFAKEDPGLVQELKKDNNFKKFNIKYTTDLERVVPRNHPLWLPQSFYWMRKYIKDSVKEFEKNNYKYLFTSIAPGISHLCGLAIKKKHPEVIWYASFSDPFKGSPYKKADNEGRSFIYKFVYSVGGFFLYNNKYEEAAVKNADKLVFICEEQRDFTIAQYTNSEELKKKSIIMTLTYVPEWDMYKKIENNIPICHDTKQAVHLGRLYGLRKINTFLDALKELKEEDKNIAEKIKFHQYSEIQKPDIKKIKDYGLEDLFILHPAVSYNESVEIMNKSDVLVLFDSLMPEEKVQPYLPSKIVEYILLKKDILAICDKNSPSYRLLKKYKHDFVGSSKDVIKKNIKSIISGERTYEYDLEPLNSDYYNMLKL